MSHLYLKITTIPCQRPSILKELRAGVTAPGNISKPESIATWIKDNGDAKAQELLLRTAYDGALGEIIAIAWAIDDNPVSSIWRGIDGGLTEADLLHNFFTALTFSTESVPRFVGHNILGFDLRFLYHRAVVNRVTPPFPLCQDVRYNSDRAFDTMQAWAGWNKYVTLQELGTALGVPVSMSLSVAEVWNCAKANGSDALADLCAQDVEALREVFSLMMFSSMPDCVAYA